MVRMVESREMGAQASAIAANLERVRERMACGMMHAIGCVLHSDSCFGMSISQWHQGSPPTKFFGSL
jgi:hypothetical protein